MSRSRSTGSGVWAGDVIASPASALVQHPVIANHGGTAEHRRFDAAFPNSALEFLERLQLRYRTGAIIGRDLGEMQKTVVFEPQGKIAHAVGPRSLEFGKYRRNQLGIAISRFRLCLVSRQNTLHGHLPG